MGYYSKVAIGMRTEAANKMVEEYHNAFGNDAYLIDKESDIFTYGENSEYSVFYWFDIKWYWEQAEWVDKYIRNIEDSPVYFIRIGENIDDTEEWTNELEREEYEIWKNCFRLVRDIEFRDED